ncbi:MAG TPA: hypothetical protein PLC89_18215, partial [Haliscomenobacter sp.]|uniref:hypothetical protein n=1 Tax=Haliscomenobacter sp. TaxID=2717303 RepID=UPI002CEA4584
MLRLCTTFILLCTVMLTFAQQKWTEEKKETFNLVRNQGGQSIAYSPNSGVKVLIVDGFAFKDL